MYVLYNVGQTESENKKKERLRGYLFTKDMCKRQDA